MTAHQKGKLPAKYLPPVTEYVEKASDKVLGQDLMGLVKILAEGSSVIAVAPQLMREKNTLFKAILASLREDLASIPAATELGMYLRSIDEAGPQYQQVLTREMQTLLLQATGKDSPIVQVAAMLPAGALNESKLPGVPLITVNQSLIGGARLFLNGTVCDDSWRARLTKLLNAVKTV